VGRIISPDATSAAGYDVALRSIQPEEGMRDFDLEGGEFRLVHYAACFLSWPVTTAFHAARTATGNASSFHKSISKAPSR
jgi:hypothetical protein